MWMLCGWSITSPLVTTAVLEKERTSVLVVVVAGPATATEDSDSAAAGVHNLAVNVLLVLTRQAKYAQVSVRDGTQGV